MAVSNILGFATGFYSNWFTIFAFTLTSACDVSCANLKAAFIIDIIFILITTYISLSAAHEQHLVSRFTPPHFGEVSEGSSSHEAFLWELLALLDISQCLENLCRKWGAGSTWGFSNILMSLCFVAMLAIITIKMNMNADGHLPPDGVVIAALVLFALLGIPLAAKKPNYLSLLSTVDISPRAKSTVQIQEITLGFSIENSVDAAAEASYACNWEDC
ncbi:UNVERIFIED_CONTAM: Sucrose transport protein SUT2 [Sesamum latifolium]|uniref:Sucrose transport protein SUT2 n=1 Tax=Sesamum latifolium TaxID=2727402 RepID=A0AAW2VWS8_9LAMI